ncbi:MAG: response regulator transcription factor [Chitinophagaceae bacterium]
MIKIVMADDHKLFRETLGILLRTQTNFEVVAQCQHSDEAIDICVAEKPDVVLMDINIKPFPGVEATEKITALTRTKVIGLSMHAHPAYAKKMLRSGAVGYVTKNSSKDEIFTAITEAVRGNRYICQETKNLLSAELVESNEEKPRINLLTGREIEVIQFIRQGLSSKEIASNMALALKTVEVHRHNILKKLQLKNSSNLVNFIYTNAPFFEQ